MGSVFYVFDDKDETGDFCFGIATVPLKELTRDKPVEGGRCTGTRQEPDHHADAFLIHHGTTAVQSKSICAYHIMYITIRRLLVQAETSALSLVL